MPPQPQLLLALSGLAAAAVASDAAAGGGSKPHIVSVLQDDLGWFDTGIHNPAAAAWTENITALAKQGIVLTNHYVHWHCSPTRRSFLVTRVSTARRLSCCQQRSRTMRVLQSSCALTCALCRAAGYRSTTASSCPATTPTTSTCG